MNDDDLRRRLRAADPATPSPADSWIPELVEATMNTPEETPKRTRPWLLGVAAAAVVAVIGAGGFALLDDDEPAPVTATPTSVTLAVPGSDSMSMCMPFDTTYLADAEVAFSGTVTDVVDAGVTLDVDHWFKGGDADQVVLEHTGPSTQVALDGVDFQDGKRYLVSASGGTVTTCGYSGPWTAEYEAQFEQAFGS